MIPKNIHTYMNLLQALTGFEVSIPHLDGHSVIVQRDKITWHGARIKKPNEGMPLHDSPNAFGTLYITFDVAFPRGELKPEDKEAVKALLSMEDKPVAVYNGL